MELQTGSLKIYSPLLKLIPKNGEGKRGRTRLSASFLPLMLLLPESFGPATIWDCEKPEQNKASGQP